MDDRTAWQNGGAWLKSLRAAAEITQRELAEQIGAPGAMFVEEVEAGRRPVPAAFHRGYARAFGVPVSEFAARCFEYYGIDTGMIYAAA